LIFLTPHIVRGPEDVSELKKLKLEELQPMVDDSIIEGSGIPDTIRQLHIVPSGEVVNHSFSFQPPPLVSAASGA
jgi:hypothetical protein